MPVIKWQTALTCDGDGLGVEFPAAAALLHAALELAVVPVVRRTLDLQVVHALRRTVVHPE